MPPKLELARAWLVKAAHDLETGARALADPPMPDTACFHAQQAVEKALKAVLVVRETEPPRTHLLAVLLERCGPIDERLSALGEQLDWLTAFAIEARYPDVEGEPSVEQAREALSTARRAFEIILDNVPEEVHP